MTFKQFRSPSNGHRRFGSRGKRLQSKLGPVISLRRLEYLLAVARQGRPAKAS
jgi:hypothetical protein